MCVEALNARPIDHVCIAEVTEIQYASDELVDVAAQCLVDLAKETESANESIGRDNAAAAAASSPTELRETMISYPVSSTCPTLLTGLTKDASDHLIDSLMEWERKFESADLEKHKQFLQEAKLPVCDSPLEARAWENGFVPEANDIPSDQLEHRIQGSLPPLAYGLQTETTSHYWRRSDASL